MSSFIPRYYEIEQALRARIVELEPGDALPSDAELCEEFAVSRMTARQAVQRLAQEGLLERVPGRGTFVAEPPAHRQAGNLLNFTTEMRRRHRTPASRLLERRAPRARRAEEAVRLKLKPGARVVVVRRLRLADGVPVAVETAVLRAACAEAGPRGGPRVGLAAREPVRRRLRADARPWRPRRRARGGGRRRAARCPGGLGAPGRAAADPRPAGTSPRVDRVALRRRPLRARHRVRRRTSPQPLDDERPQCLARDQEAALDELLVALEAPVLVLDRDARGRSRRRRARRRSAASAPRRGRAGAAPASRCRPRTCRGGRGRRGAPRGPSRARGRCGRRSRRRLARSRSSATRGARGRG